MKSLVKQQHRRRMSLILGCQPQNHSAQKQSFYKTLNNILVSIDGVRKIPI